MSLEKGHACKGIFCHLICNQNSQSQNAKQMQYPVKGKKKKKTKTSPKWEDSQSSSCVFRHTSFHCLGCTGRPM